MKLGLRFPKTPAGVTCLVALTGIFCFFAIFGIVYLINTYSIGCVANPNSISRCNRDIVSTVFLLILGVAGPFGAILVSPFLAIIALVAGAICVFRKAW